MGMFSSLFGSSGSDKADKMRQQALDAFNSVKTPELSALQVQLNNYVNAGKITPEEAEAQMLNSNAFNAIKTDPSFTGAAKQALQGLQSVASQGGTTAIDKARLQDITDQQNQENKSANAAVMENAQARGMGNSNLTATNELINEQGSADRAGRAGLQVSADAQARALQALQASGQLGQSMQAQDFSQQATKAASQNAIDQFNAANATDMSKFNTSNNLATQQANLANAQNINNLNTGTQNQNKEYNAAQNQTVYNDEMGKAAGKAGVSNQWAGDAQKQAQNEAGANMALTGQLIGAGAKAAGTAFGGGAEYSEGGVVEPKQSLEDEYAKFVKQFCGGGTINMSDGGKVHIKPAKAKGFKGYSDGGDVSTSTDSAHVPVPEPKKDEDKKQGLLAMLGNMMGGHADEAHKLLAMGEADGGMIHDYRGGGKVPGQAKVAGDSPKNDTVPANLSPGEVVLPRTVVHNPEKIAPFVKATTGYDPIAAALRRLHQPKL